MVFPDDIRIIAGTPIVWGVPGATVGGLSVTKDLSLNGLSPNSARQGISTDLADANGRLPRWLSVSPWVETGTAPTANTVVTIHLGFSRDPGNFPGGFTGADASYDMASQAQLGFPASIFVAATVTNLLRGQQPSWVRTRGRYVTAAFYNQMDQALRSQGNPVDQGSGIIVVPYFEVLETWGQYSVINVKDYGAVGNGVVDDTVAIQAAVSAAASGSIIYLPLGEYKVTSSLVFDGKQLRVLGDSAVGTRLQGSINGPIIDNAPDAEGFPSGTSFEHLQIVNSHANGIGLQYNSFVVGAIRHVFVSAYRGIIIAGATELSGGTFTVLVEQARLYGIGGSPVGSVGILTGGHAQILSSDIVGFDHGIRASGATVNIMGCRLEVNRTGIMAGLDRNGGTFLLTRSVIAGNSFEANDTAIAVRAANHVVFEGMAIQGSTNAPSGQSQFGLDVGGTMDVLFQSIEAGSGYDQAAIRVTGTHTRLRFSQVLAWNGLAGKKAWDVMVPLSQAEFHQTSYDLRADGTGTPVLHERLVARSLAAVDQVNGGVLGKNLRGKAVPVSSGATSKAVTFSTALATGDAAIETATAASGGGTLAAGTYYYIASLVNEAGETGAVTEKTVVVSSPNNQVGFTFYGVSTSGWKRRIYRGTASGVYDGYFETGLEATTFTDIGGALTGLKSPMGSGFDAETSMQEPDANYAVIITPAWNTTVWVTNKATTGFTVHFGTGPGADSSFDWFIVR
jgi:hypothetical protein